MFKLRLNERFNVTNWDGYGDVVDLGREVSNLPTFNTLEAAQVAADELSDKIKPYTYVDVLSIDVVDDDRVVVYRAYRPCN